jgi:hypothetical protein
MSRDPKGAIMVTETRNPVWHYGMECQDFTGISGDNEMVDPTDIEFDALPTSRAGNGLGPLKIS